MFYDRISNVCDYILFSVYVYVCAYIMVLPIDKDHI